MADGSHRLAASVSRVAAEAAEQARDDAQAGGGVELAHASAAELATLGLSADVEIPAGDVGVLRPGAPGRLP